MGNNTKIKYLNIKDKVYEVTRISFFYMTIEASETDLAVDDVLECEIWDIGDFERYKVRLINGSGNGKAEIVDFSDWVNRRK